jgi:hypothetical protein
MLPPPHPGVEIEPHTSLQTRMLSRPVPVEDTRYRVGKLQSAGPESSDDD